MRAPLDQIIDMRHELVRLGRLIDWRLTGSKLGEVFSDNHGQPPLPARLTGWLREFLCVLFIRAAFAIRLSPRRQLRMHVN